MNSSLRSSSIRHRTAIKLRTEIKLPAAGSVLTLALASLIALSACGHGNLKQQQAPSAAVRAANGPPAGPGPDAVAAADSEPGEPPEEEDCLVDQAGARRFLPRTSVPSSARILPATENDCGFYNWAWHNFLYQTRLEGDRPAFFAHEPFEQVFGLSQAGAEKAKPGLPVLNAGFRQAGDLAAILVDTKHRPIFYSLHINRVFADFVRAHKLNQLDRLLKEPAAGGAPRDLEFPPGSLELKAAWRVLDADEQAGDYITQRALIPILANRGGEVVATGETREARVALLSLHVVGVVQDHPEFIWATFEHADSGGRRDLAPAAIANPVEGQPQRLDERSRSYPLFLPGTPAQFANQALRQPIDEASQTFAASTPVYRVYPASFNAESDEDLAVTTLNQHIGELFEQTDPAAEDKRRHYRLVGAVWIDQPGADRPDGVFKADQRFENSGDTAVLAGEDSLSSLAMESFTQHPMVNCLSCHDTTRKQVNKDVYLPPRRLNVSNALSFYAKLKLALK